MDLADSEIGWAPVPSPAFLAAIFAGTLGLWWIVGSFGRRNSNAPPRFRKLFLFDLVGLTLQYLRDPLKLAWEAREKLGNCYTISIVGRKLTFLCGPEAQSVFYNAPIQLFDHSHYNVPLDPQSDAADAKKLEERIAILKTALAPPHLERMMLEMERQISTYLDTWGDAGEVELYPALSELVSAVCARSFLGEAMTQGSERLQLLPLELSALSPVNTPLSLLFSSLPSYSDLSKEQAAESFTTALGAIIRQRKGAAKERNPEDLVQLLVDARYSDGSALSTHEIGGLLLGVMGGQERVAVGAAWTGVDLLYYRRSALLPKVQAEEGKARDLRLPGEGEGGGQRVLKRRKKNQALEHAIEEALATHPSLSLLNRRVAPGGEKLPDGYGGYNLPEDHTLVLCPYFAGPLPVPGASPTPPEPAPPEPRTLWGSDRVTCGGKELSLSLISCIWGYLIHHMDLQLIPPPPMPLPGSLVQYPAPPCRLRYSRRIPLELEVPGPGSA